MDVKLVKWEKETEQESIRFRLGFTRVMEMHIRTNQGLANAAIPRRISCRVSPPCGLVHRCLRGLAARAAGESGVLCMLCTVFVIRFPFQ
jgi:hypothetical protein